MIRDNLHTDPDQSSASLLDRPQESLRFRFRGGQRDGQVIRVNVSKCTIGSAPDATLRLVCPGVQPIHCLILRGSGGTAIRRMSPDTFLNRQPFTDARLQPGDCLRVGPIEFEVLGDSQSTSRGTETSLSTTRIVADRMREELEEARTAWEQQRDLERQRLDDISQELDERARQLEINEETQRAENNDREAQLQEELETARTQLGELQTQRDQAEEEWTHAREEMNSEIASLREQLSGKDQEIADVTNQLEALRLHAESFGETSDELDQLRAQCEQLTLELETTRQELAGTTSAEALAELQAGWDAERSALQEQVSSFQSEVDELKTRCEQAEATAAEANTFKESLESLQVKVQELESSREQDQIALESARQSLLDVQGELRDVQAASQAADKETEFSCHGEEQSCEQMESVESHDELGVEQQTEPIEFQEEAHSTNEDVNIDRTMIMDSTAGSFSAEDFVNSAVSSSNDTHCETDSWTEHVEEESAEQTEVEHATSPDDFAAESQAENLFGSTEESANFEPDPTQEPDDYDEFNQQNSDTSWTDVTAEDSNRQQSAMAMDMLDRLRMEVSGDAEADETTHLAEAGEEVAEYEAADADFVEESAIELDNAEAIEETENYHPTTEEELTYETPNEEAPVDTASILAKFGHSLDFEDDEPASPATETSVITEPVEAFQPMEEDGESIENYMNQLMQRVGGGSYESQSPAEDAEQSETVKVETEQIEQPKQEVTTPLDPSEFVPRTVARLQSSNLQELRAVANTSARSAIDKHQRRSYERAGWLCWFIAIVCAFVCFAMAFFAKELVSLPALFSLVAFSASFFAALRALAFSAKAKFGARNDAKTLPASPTTVDADQQTPEPPAAG